MPPSGICTQEITIHAHLGRCLTSWRTMSTMQKTTKPTKRIATGMSPAQGMSSDMVCLRLLSELSPDEFPPTPRTIVASPRVSQEFPMRVRAALSGGVDSAVAAARAVEAGHDVVGVHMALSRNRDEYRNGSRGCCSLAAASDARRAADVLGIPYYVWDLSEEFE